MGSSEKGASLCGEDVPTAGCFIWFADLLGISAQRKFGGGSGQLWGQVRARFQNWLGQSTSQMSSARLRSDSVADSWLISGSGGWRMQLGLRRSGMWVKRGENSGLYSWPLLDGLHVLVNSASCTSLFVGSFEVTL